MKNQALRKVLVWTLAIIIIAVFSIFIANHISIYEKAGNDFNTYCEQLLELNEEHLDQFSSRIIVKTDRKIKDDKCIASASGFAGLNVLQYQTEQQAKQALEYYSSLGYVEYAQMDVEVNTQEIDETTTGSYSSVVDTTKHLSWGADLLGVDVYQRELLVKYANAALPTVYVAVLDTGIDTDHEFLRGRIAYEYGVSFYDSVKYTNRTSSYMFEDDNSHGTHVAGTIVDLTLGNVMIVPIKVLNNEGSGSLAIVMSGMEYAIQLKENGVNVVAYNMSLGGGGYSEKQDALVNLAYENNIMPVVAAGNDSYHVEYFNPASCRNALTISALSQNDIYQNFPHIAYYSNYGSYVDLCLPGTNVLSSVPDDCSYSTIYKSESGDKYAVISGTSMATPHATALVALYATWYGDDYDVRVVEKNIKSNTYDFGDVGFDNCYGYGIPSMALVLAGVELDAEPQLSVGKVNSICSFEGRIDVEIINANTQVDGMTYKVYYTTDGSYPTLVSFTEYVQPIKIEESTLLRFVIYLFDADEIVRGRSSLYEVTYYQNDLSNNNNGVGFTIDAKGMLTRYTSGLKNIVIPEYVDGIKVKGLSRDLFLGLNIESVECPFDVKIDYYPFVSCASLKSITLYSTEAKYIVKSCFALQELILPNINSIQRAYGFSTHSLPIYMCSPTFSDCFSLERFVAPNVVEIPYGAFSGLIRLNEIDIDWDNVTSIDGYALNYTAIKELNLPRLNYLGKSALQDCSELETVVLSDNLTEILPWTFDGCENLQNINLQNIETIGKYSFFGCDSLTNVDLTSVQNIEYGAFVNCDNLLVVNLGSNEYLISTDISWCSNYYTKVIMIDIDYKGEVGRFIQSHYKHKYQFENYDYTLYASEKIVTATFQCHDGAVLAQKYYLWGDKIDGQDIPTSYEDEIYTYEILNWKRNGTLSQILYPKDFSKIYDNEVYVVNSFNKTYHNVDYVIAQAKQKYNQAFIAITGKAASDTDIKVVSAYTEIELAALEKDIQAVLSSVNNALCAHVSVLLDMLLVNDSEECAQIVKDAKMDALLSSNDAAVDGKIVDLDNVFQNTIKSLQTQRIAEKDAAKQKLRTVTQSIYDSLTAERKINANELYYKYDQQIDFENYIAYANIVESAQKHLDRECAKWTIDDLAQGIDDESIVDMVVTAKSAIDELGEQDNSVADNKAMLDRIVKSVLATINEYLNSQHDDSDATQDDLWDANDDESTISDDLPKQPGGQEDIDNDSPDNHEKDEQPNDSKDTSNDNQSNESNDITEKKPIEQPQTAPTHQENQSEMSSSNYDWHTIDGDTNIIIAIICITTCSVLLLGMSVFLAKRMRSKNR